MPTDTDKLFSEMADRIIRNAGEMFGGAFVVVPPAEGGDSLSVLLLDTKTDPAQFWQMLLTKCQMMVGELDAKQRQSAFGGRR